MPEPSTTRLALYKPLNDGSENVNVQTDLNQNWDKVDLAAGFQIVTSSTRPAAPYAGKGIAESDTTYRTYFSNGTSPASASWVEIPNSGATYNSNLTMANSSIITIGDANLYRSAADTLTTDDIFRIIRSTAGANALSLRVTGDTASRFFVNADGGMRWGPGGGSGSDTTLDRTGVGTLALTGALTVSGTAAAQVETTTTGATPATDFAVTTFSGRRTCGIASVSLLLTYSGATLTGSASGNITDTNCATLPSGWRPAHARTVSFDRGGITFGTGIIETTGVITLKTLHATGAIASGNTITVTDTYVL